MPLGVDDYDVVIGVSVADRTAPGSASVRRSVTRDMDDIRRYGDKQAREFGRTSRDIFNQTDQHATRSASSMVRRLTHIFDTNNFLLRNMARQAGSTTGAIAIGVGKIALSYSKLGKDTEDASHRGRVALTDLKLAVSRLGSDPSAFPAALKSTRDLSAAYESMGKSGHAASIKAGSALEEMIHKRVVNLQGGLVKAQSNFEKLRINASKDSDLLRGKIDEISASVSHLLGGARVDAPFFKSFIKARTENEKFILVNEKLGARAAVAYAAHQKEIEKLSASFAKLESRATKSIRSQTDQLAAASTKVRNHKNELDLLEKSLIKVSGATDGAAASTGILTSKVVASGVAIGVVLGVVLAVIVAVAILAGGMYKGATTAAKYGDEIYKLALSTGLTVKTLSALSIIARETNTDVDSLAKTFTRTQIQIQRGLDKPFSEAGRALRTLKVDFQELRKANPDQQIFTMAKAFTELNNQNVRATVSQQLFSRDAERQAKMLEQIANGFVVAQQKAKKYGLELDESGAVKAHLATVAMIDLKLAWEGLWVAVGTRILPPLTILMEKFTESIVTSGGAFKFFADIAVASLGVVRAHVIFLKDVMEGGIARAVIINALDPNRISNIIKKEDAEQNAEYQRRVIELRKRGLQGDDQYAPGKGPRSNMDRLEDRVRKLRFEIQALQDVGSKRFMLRFELEDLEKVKSGFETIFKLRNQMGLTLDQPVPQFRVFGTPEEQREDLANIHSYVQQMERMKTTFEGVRKVANEQSDALAELARVQQEALMPVVDAGTLAEIKYQTAIRDRAKAEKELTADVIAETKIRKDVIADEVGSTLKAYMTLQRDLGRSQDVVREQRTQDQLFIKILKGDIDTEQAVRASLKDRMGSTAVPQVPSELMAIAAHAATIDLNVASIAEKIGANVHNVSNTNITSPGSQTGYATTSLVRRNSDGTVTIVAEEDLNQKITSQTTDPGYLRRRIFDESRQRAGGERDAEVRKTNQSIIDDQMRMEQALIDIDTDYLRHFTNQQLVRRAEARETTVSIMLLENDIRDLSNANSELYKRTWEEANESRLSGHRALKDEIIQLQNDIANNGFNQGDRENRAYLQSIRDIQEASNQARESIIYNQVQIADKTIYHADIANAKVLDFLANQRSITDVIADAKIGVIDSTFSAIDRALDKFTSKLGIAGDLTKELLSGFIRLALSPFFKTLYGGGSNQGGIFGGIPGMGGGQGPGGTPVFNGFNSLIPGLSGLSSASAASPESVSAPGPWKKMAEKIGFPGSSQKQPGILSSLMSALPALGLAYGIDTWTSILSGQPVSNFQAITGGGILGFFINRNIRRRQEETKRDAISKDTGTAIWQLIDQARLGDMTQVEANSEWNRIDIDYHARIAEIKDGKTRRHAELQWKNDFFPLKKILDKAVEGSMERANIRERMIPVFGGGGWSRENQLIKVRPGEGVHYPGTNIIQTVFGKDRGYDTEFMYVPKGTRILNQKEMTTATPMQMGGMIGNSNTSNDLPELHIDSLELILDSDGLASIVVRSPHFKKAVIHNVKVGKKEKKLA